ncbi:MAG TPA: ParA family protein [Polyangia bacterium]|jgi:chromosome partitioning protein
MGDNGSPKTIATINFKGGVGKTTVTWCLADVISSFADAKVLVFDLDAQMSLTQAIALNEVTGKRYDKFGQWQDQSIARKKTIFDALDQFARPAQKFDFPVGWDFIYQITDSLHFVPSVEDLYWMELEVFDRDAVKDFIRRLLGKIANCSKFPKYDYVLFDCPPSFTLLSYSVLSCCDLVLIPVNPDFFASKGTNLILNSLKMRIEPFPVPKIGVFMNKTKTYAGQPTKESQFYMREIERVCDDAVSKQQIQARFFDAWIPERVGVKRAITGGGVPADLVDPFKLLWTESIGYVP